VAGWAYFLILWIAGARLMLIFPAVAADDPDPANHALERDRGNWLRLYVGSLACYLPYFVLEALVPVLLRPKMTATTKFMMSSGAFVSFTQGGGLLEAISSVLDFLELAVMIAPQASS
jgi:hypothetical protein